MTDGIDYMAFERLIHGVLKRKRSQVRPKTALYEDLVQELWIVLIKELELRPNQAAEKNLNLYILLFSRAADYLKKERRSLMRNVPTEIDERILGVSEPVVPEMELTLLALIESMEDSTMQGLLNDLLSLQGERHHERRKRLNMSRATYYRKLAAVRQMVKNFLKD